MTATAGHSRATGPQAADALPCGPLRVTLRAEDARLRGKLEEIVGLFDAPWPGEGRPVTIEAAYGPPGEPAEGTWLRTTRMRVQARGPELVASCTAGASAASSGERTRWRLTVPPGDDVAAVEETEELVLLAITTGWRAAGWVPVHAGAVASGSGCSLVCATSGGGKSTLGAALVRRGWRTLGDDKLLVDRRTGEARGVATTSNLDPGLARWFPELGDLGRLPTYSRYTDKRKARLEELWPGARIAAATPTHLIELDPARPATGVRVVPMDRAATLSALLRQTVVPSDRREAAAIVETIARTAARIRGLRVAVAPDALDGGLGPLEEALA